MRGGTSVSLLHLVEETSPQIQRSLQTPLSSQQAGVFSSDEQEEDSRNTIAATVYRRTFQPRAELDRVNGAARQPGGR